MSYFSAPGLSWDAMLKVTKIELEKISDADIHLFIEKGMRGGISYINKRNIVQIMIKINLKNLLLILI